MHVGAPSPKTFAKCKKYFHFIDCVELKKKNFIGIQAFIIFLKELLFTVSQIYFHYKFYELHDKCEEWNLQVMFM